MPLFFGEMRLMKKDILWIPFVSLLTLATVGPTALWAQTYSFTGAVDTDFFNVLNWDDGLGGMPASIVDGGTGTIELDLVIDGMNAVAGGAVEFGAGMLALANSATFDVSTGDVTFGSGSSLGVMGSTLNLLDNSAKLALNDGSSTSLNDATINGGDDIYFRGTTSISDSMVVSRTDDVEFQDTAVISAISGSHFETLDIVQIVSFQSSANIVNSSFTTGRLSIRTGTDLVASDSDFNLNGDIDDAFNAITFGTLTLQGTTTLRADQLDEGITLFLEDSSSASFIDDNQEGEWITASSAATGAVPSTVVFKSADASLTFAGGPQDPLSDDATQVIHALSGVSRSYAQVPTWFSPSNWDGFNDVTITIALVPEPTTGLLSLGLIAATCIIRRR